MSTDMLELRSLSTGYGAVTVVRDVSLSAAPGEMVVLVGANGAGKSTLLQTVAGLLRPSAGMVRLDGEDVTGFGAEAMARRGVVLVPEGRRLFGPMTVRENLLLGRHVRRRQRQGAAGALRRVLDLFPALGERANQRSDSLSGGEQQMVALGRALMSDPKLLLLDEPSLGLAPVIVRELFQTLSTLREHGTTIVLVEQHAAMALSIADRAYVLERGRIVLEGTGRDVAGDPKVQAAYLGHPAVEVEASS